MKFRNIFIGLFLIGLCAHGEVPKDARSDVLYYDDTPAGHDAGRQIAQKYGFKQEVIYKRWKVDKRIQPRALSMPTPRYPKGGIGNKLHAEVKVAVIISEKGMVSEAAVYESSNPELNKSVLQTVRLWKFEPASWDGVAVRVVLLAPITFDAK